MTIALIGKDLWTGIPLLEKAIRTVAVYVGILVLLRVGGKRDLAQLDSFDLVVLLLMSNVVQNAIIGNDTSLSGGLIGVTVLFAVNALVIRVFRSSPRGVRLFEGSSTTLVHDGRTDDRAIRRLGLRMADVVNAVRRQGASGIPAVKQAVLQPGGTITVELNDADQPATRRDLAELSARLEELLAGRGDGSAKVE